MPWRPAFAANVGGTITRAKMGTLVSIATAHCSQQQSRAGVEAAYAAIDSLSSILDRHNAHTPMARLNHDGVLQAVPEHLSKVLDAAQSMWRTSGGAFNPAVAPVLELFRSKARSGEMNVSAQELDRLLLLTDFSAMRRQGDAVQLETPGMALTLDGLAKGYVVDQASKAMAAAGVENFCINAGGDIRTGGRRNDGQPWRVAVRNPDPQGRYPGVLNMDGGAAATSGNYEVFFDRRKDYHHLVDPATARSPRALASATVTADTVMEADALSTAVFVLGPRRGLELVESLPGRECLLVGRDGGVRTSSGWKQG